MKVWKLIHHCTVIQNIHLYLNSNYNFWFLLWIAGTLYFMFCLASLIMPLDYIMYYNLALIHLIYHLHMNTYSLKISYMENFSIEFYTIMYQTWLRLFFYLSTERWKATILTYKKNSNGNIQCTFLMLRHRQ